MVKTQLLSKVEHENRGPGEKEFCQALRQVVGDDQVLEHFADRIAYGRDRWPYGTLRYRFGKTPGSVPPLVVVPGTYEEVSQVVKLANEHHFALIPYGLGSGVLGGAVPLAREVTIDLKQLNQVVNIDEISCLATVQAGMNGELFEAALNKRKLTLGHFPQSLYDSSVGGWMSCRGAGQASSRYGKIEDMVVGLKAVLPDGRFLEVRPVPRRAVGPSIKDIFIGAEGTLGIILEGTLRVLPYPERQTIHAVGFKDYLTALEALRKIMQSELRPAVVRLYDEIEARSKIKGFPEYQDHPCLAMFIFAGLPELVEVEEHLTLDICKKLGGIEGSPEPTHQWIEERFISHGPKYVYEGKMMDTIEIAAPWIALPDLYEGMKEAIAQANPEAHCSAHWSHVYTDGACMYVTFHMPAPDEEKAALDHFRIWDGCMKVCLKGGGTISHHHGVGYFRGQWLAEELNTGHDLLQTLKDGIDPNHIMNPGKLALK